MKNFVHLHLHTQYSFLDGAIKIKELMPRIKELGMKSVAITDHGNMHGVLEFYKAAQKEGIKAIIGCETYISKKGRKTRHPKDSYHLVLLAKNQQGYRNLMHLVSLGFIEGFYYKPRIDKEILKELSEGLIGMSACLGGEISQAILSGDLVEARKVAQEYRDIFEKDSFYLEIQQNGLPEQAQVNKELIKIARELNIPLVATADSHYIKQKHAKAHDILMKIQMKQTISSPRYHTSEAYYVRSPEEIYKEFADTPDAIENTLKIAEMCNVDIQTGTYYLPDFPLPEGYDVQSYFEHVSWEGLKFRLQENNITDPQEIKTYNERLQFEIDVINQMGFQGYFLIVWDFIKYAKDHQIPVGPGRGSGAGSLVAYSLLITDLDPLPLNLLFERFLNPDRVSMPDFDIDFCQDKRGEVIEYVKNKYGENRVAQIASFSQLKAKSVIRDVGRVLEIPLKEVDVLAKMIPDDLDIDLNKALDRNPKINEAMENNSDYKNIIEIGMALEGLYRQPGVHAAGIVIGNQDLWNYSPLLKGNDGFYITQFEKNNVEEVGLVKFDFLGLKTLTVIDRAVSYVNSHREPDQFLDISKIKIKDPNIYKTYQQGNTDGVFQFESEGMKKYLKELRPDCFEDIIAMNALYRPGPMEHIPAYIRRKHGQEKVTYDHPCMAEFLQETNGITVYQEQVMLLSRKMGGFTRGQADTLRKAMGKKKKDLLDKLFPIFLEGCQTIHNMDEKIVRKVWGDWEEFAKYAFNKSHAACYAYVSLQTAYLKFYHPAEFMAAILSFEAHDNTKVVKHVISAQEMGLVVVPPAINRSLLDFTAENSDVIFGLGGIKGIGSAAIDNIIEVRAATGPFKSLFDLAIRVDGRKVNKKALEALIKAGTMDALHENRREMFENLDRLIQSAQAQQKQKKAGLKSLFGGHSEHEELTKFQPEPFPRWEEKIRLKFEREVLGFYISGHPVTKYYPEFKRYDFPTLLKVLETPPGPRDKIALLAMPDGLRVIFTRDKKQMAAFTLEDHTGSISGICFPKNFEKLEDQLKAIHDQPVIFIGTLKQDRMHQSEDSDDIKYNFHLEDIMTQARYREHEIKKVTLTLIDEAITPEQITELGNLLSHEDGITNINLAMRSQKYDAEIYFAPQGELKTKMSHEVIQMLTEFENQDKLTVDYTVS